MGQAYSFVLSARVSSSRPRRCFIIRTRTSMWRYFLMRKGGRRYDRSTYLSSDFRPQGIYTRTRSIIPKHHKKITKTHAGTSARAWADCSYSLGNPPLPQQQCWCCCCLPRAQARSTQQSCFSSALQRKSTSEQVNEFERRTPRRLKFLLSQSILVQFCRGPRARPKNNNATARHRGQHVHRKGLLLAHRTFHPRG